MAGISLRPPGADDLDRIVALDRRHFPADRSGFVREWVLPRDPATRRQSLISLKEDRVTGLGTIRTCRDGYKIGPLFAAETDTARGVFEGLRRLVPDGSAVSLDVPEDNAQAVELAVAAQLSPVFETARMNCGEAPGLPLNEIYGITTFELG